MPSIATTSALARVQLRSIAACVISAASLAACGGDAPATAPSPPTVASPAVVTAYLDTAILFTQTYFYYGDRVDWSGARRRAVARAAGAQTFRDTYPAIDTLERELNDIHTYFLPPQQTLGNREDPSGPLYTPISVAITPKIGYLWLTSFGGTNAVARADTLQRLIAEADSATGGACGWIIDERANIGGFWPVMLAGISPLVTPGIVGGFVERDPKFKFSYWAGDGTAGLEVATSGERFQYIATTRQYRLRRPSPPVALIQGQFTASAGEIVVMAFKDSTRVVRTFGGPSTGATTQPYTYVMRDTASLLVTAAMMFDRRGRTYNGQPIPADQTASGPGVTTSFTSAFRPATRGDGAIEPAIAWLESQQQCRVAADADRDTPSRANDSRWRRTAPPRDARPASEWPRGRPTPWTARLSR